MAPIHSPTSRALAREVLSPTMRSGASSWLLMKRMRDVIICAEQQHLSALLPPLPGHQCVNHTTRADHNAVLVSDNSSKEEAARAHDVYHLRAAAMRAWHASHAGATAFLVQYHAAVS